MSDTAPSPDALPRVGLSRRERREAAPLTEATSLTEAAPLPAGEGQG